MVSQQRRSRAVTAAFVAAHCGVYWKFIMPVIAGKKWRTLYGIVAIADHAI